MSGIYIPGMKKPKECGHHLDTYKTVLSCPLARANGACKLQEYTGRKRPNFKEQYKHCPMLGVPDHGPLRDVDKVLDELAHNLGIRSLDYLTPSERAIVSWFCDAPTIIPADKEEGK